MIYVIATTPMKPENKDDFIKGHKACIAETLKEKGCLSYEGHVSMNNPNLYVVVERWETRDDLNAHGKAPHMKVWREYSSQMKTAPTVIEIISDAKVEKFYPSHDPRHAKSGASIAGRKPQPIPSCSISTIGTGGGWR